MEAAANYAVFAIVGIAIVSWFFHTSRTGENRLALYSGGIACVISLAIALVISHFYFHPRPFIIYPNAWHMHHAADSSFPSDHATGGFAVAAGVGIYRHRLGLLLLVLALLTAFSRVFVGIHWPADVAGGAAIGILVAIGVWLARPLLTWLDRSIVLRLVPAPLQ